MKQQSLVNIGYIMVSIMIYHGNYCNSTNAVHWSVFSFTFFVEVQTIFLHCFTAFYFSLWFITKQFTFRAHRAIACTYCYILSDQHHCSPLLYWACLYRLRSPLLMDVVHTNDFQQRSQRYDCEHQRLKMQIGHVIEFYSRLILLQRKNDRQNNLQWYLLRKLAIGAAYIFRSISVNYNYI